MITATQLRQNIYKILDQVLEDKIPVEVERKGKILKIVPEETISKFDMLEEHDYIADGDGEDLVHIDWSGFWSGDKDL